MHDSVLISFAILHTNWNERRKSYIDNFVPFVAECLRAANQPEISASELQACLESEFGLRLPQHVIQTVLHRAAKEKLVRRDGQLLVRTDRSLVTADLGAARRDALRQHEALVTKLSTYARNVHQEELGREAAESALLDFIENRSLPVMRQLLGNPGPQDLQERSIEFIVAAFIARLCESDPEGFKYLDTVVKGSMLATALYLPTPGSMGGPIRDLRVFLDTPVLLRALGYHGASQEEASMELLDMLASLGARLMCFTHTLRELQGVLISSGRTLQSPKRQGDVVLPVIDYAVERGITASELEARADGAEHSLRALRVVVEDPPEMATALSVDEDELEEELRRVINYARPQARVHDLNCLTAVYRLRRGTKQRELESARAIFVTTNANVVRASRRFFEEVPNGADVPVCALDHELGTVVWLKTPLSVPDFPRKQILADAYAALSPDDAIWRKYMEFVDRLTSEGKVSDDDYVVLRYSTEARRALMERTLGDSAGLSIGTIPEILARAREASAHELREQLTAAQAAAETDRIKLARAREALTSARQQAASERSAVSRATDEAALRHRETVVIRADAVAHTVSLAVFGIMLAVAGVAVFLTLPSPFPELGTGAGRAVTLSVGLAVLVAGVLAIVGIGWGVSLKGIAASIEFRLSKRLRRHFVRWFVSDTTGESDSSDESPAK